jgi:hypothetical protein
VEPFKRSQPFARRVGERPFEPTGGAGTDARQQNTLTRGIAKQLIKSRLLQMPDQGDCIASTEVDDIEVLRLRLNTVARGLHRQMRGGGHNSGKAPVEAFDLLCIVVARGALGSDPRTLPANLGEQEFLQFRVRSVGEPTTANRHHSRPSRWCSAH